MEPITRRESKDLRRLAGIAYDRELSRELTRLETSFAEWRAGQRTAHDVSAAIHEFHDGVARDLWVLYNRVDPSSTVPRAVVSGVLAEDEVPTPLLAKLHNALEFYRHESDRSDSDPLSSREHG
jgi:hypothetical protein